MKKLTFLWCLLFCLTATVNAQNLQSSTDEIMQRYSQVGNQTGSISDFFTPQEQVIIRQQLNQRSLPTPMPQVAALLDRLEVAGKSSMVEPMDLFNDYERGLLQDYYKLAYPLNSQYSAPGDVHVLNLRASCGNEVGNFPLAGPYTINPIGVSTTPIFSGDLDDTGTIYAMDNTALTLLSIDPVTWVETTVGPLTNLVAGHNTRGMAWNEANGTLYLLSGLGDDVTLYTVDRATGTLTVVGTSTIAGIVGIWLAIDNAGNAFMADIGLDNLYSMDLNTGTATLVGPLGINISFAQDADFDPDTGTLYMAAYIGGGVNFWASVDTATGTATTLGTVNADCAEIGIAAIEGTPIVPPAPGLAYGTVTFPAPTYFANWDPADPTVLTNVGPTPAVNFEGGGAIDPTDPTTAYVMDVSGDFYSVDVATGVHTNLGTVNQPGGETVSGLEFDSTTGTLYMLSTDIATSTLSTIDIGALTSTPVGATGMAGGIALAIDGAGNGWAYDIVDDNFYAVDLGTGAATLVGPIGFDGNFGQGMTWDPASDTIYMAAFNNGAFAGEWRTVDTATGATTLVGVLGGTTPGGTNQLGWTSMPNNSTPADNDTCADATQVECGNTYLGDTSDNTDQGGFDTAPDEWFKYTGPGAGMFEYVTISLCDGGTGYDSRLTVYDACGGAQVATNDDFCGLQSELTFTSNGTTTYYVAVEGFGGATGAFSLAVSCVPAPPPPPNDFCANAIEVQCGDFVAGTTIDATIDDAVAPLCDTGVTSPGVWYVLNDNTGLVTDITITMCTGTTDYDAKLSVYTGDCGAPPLTCVVGNDDTCGLQSEVSFQSDGNTTFLILVHGFGGATGNFELDIQCTPIPPPNDDIANSIDIDEIGCPYTDPAVAMPAATVEGANPTGCNIDGANGVWYNLTPVADGEVTATIVTPAGASFVNFFTAPDENASVTDLVLVDWWDNQCAPSTSTTIPVVAGQAYYIFVVNSGGITDIVIDCDILGVDDNAIAGFSFYPNPANEVLNLNSVDIIENVAVFNMLGQKVLDQTIEATNSQVSISHLATGTYVMKVAVNGQVGTYKLVKE